MRSDRTAGQYSINARNSSIFLPPPDGRFPLADVSKFTILLEEKCFLLVGLSCTGWWKEYRRISGINGILSCSPI
jgi:hypothetical protein